jgi:hypothetical protein
LRPYDPQQYNDVFQKAVVDPTMQVYNRQIVPGIQQRFVDANAGSSSALNQALGQSAADLSTSLGSQYLNFFNQQQSNTLNALNGITGIGGQRTFEPLVSQSEGILGPLIGAGGKMAAAGIMSSEKVKQNIRDYDKGLDLLCKFKVKHYDYIEKVGGEKNKVGLIAESLPSELRTVVHGVEAVDVYGLVGVLINSVKELSEKVEMLEALHGDCTTE